MCRHVAYLGPPVPLASILYDPPQSLLRQSWAPRHQRYGTVNADGYGVGWYDPGVRPEPARFRRAGPMWADRSLESLARVVRTGALLAAVRSATPPAPMEETGAAPFTDGRWLFSLNGVVAGDLTLLRRQVSAHREAGIQGASDAEVLFALLLDRLDRIEALEGLDGLDGPSPGAALGDLVAAVPGRLNLLLCDGATIWATVCGDTLWWRSTSGTDPSVLVASEPLDDDADWVAVADRSLLTASVCAVAGTAACSVVPLPLPTRRRPHRPTRSASPVNPSIEVLLSPDDLFSALRTDVLAGLSAPSGRRSLPPKWFYDERGSQLFDEITRLPEYYPTRCERAILEGRADAIMASDAGAVTTLIELGSGTSDKTRLLLDAGVNRGRLRTFVPFDVSEETLRVAAGMLAQRYHAAGLAVHAVVGDFERHLAILAGLGEPGGRLVAFLGGTIGNFDPPGRARFLRALAGALAPGDRLLLGTDLVKDPARLVLAYDDPAGVTAEFNRNVLAVINRRLGGDFDGDSFAHVAVWDEVEEWIEMRLRSQREQTVTVSELPIKVDFATGEEMRTEISAKFRPEKVARELAGAGFALDEWWTDAGGDFGLSLSHRLG